MGNAISDVRVYPEYEVEMNALSADQTTGNTELLNTSLASSGPFSPSAVDSTVARTTSRTGSVSDNSVWLKNSTVAGKSFSSEDLSAQGVDVDSSVSAIVYGGNVYGLSGNGASSNTVTLIDSLVSKTYNVYATVADGAVYGGYLGLHLYHLDDEKPTIQADTAAKTATVDDSYITADAEKAGANSNIVNVSYSLDASTA